MCGQAGAGKRDRMGWDDTAKSTACNSVGWDGVWLGSTNTSSKMELLISIMLNTLAVVMMR